MRRACLTQGYPPARLNRRFALSPVDALVDIKIGCGLRRQVPVRLDLHTITRLRITVLPQRWPACPGYAWGLGVHADVLQDLPDLRALGNERDQAHLPTTHRTQQREISIS